MGAAVRSAVRLADPEGGVLDDVIDTARWPLAGDGPDVEDLALRLRRQLDRDGVATLPGFARPSAVATIEAEFDALTPYVEILTDHRSVYAREHVGTRPDTEVPTGRDHVGAGDSLVDLGLEVDDGLTSTWRAGHITRDMIPPHSPAHRLYVSPAFKRLVAAAVGVERVYEYADPLAGLVATVVPPGGCYGWHYDTNEFVVTIPIRQPDVGGWFEYCPDLRRPGDENVAGARRVIAGEAPEAIRRLCGEPGDLQIFRGRYSLHRVSPVGGATSRLTLVLSYADRPGVIGPIDRTRRVYGRVTEAHLLAGAVVAGADGLIL